jgi:peptide/nickel transport system ATP-binding protein
MTALLQIDGLDVRLGRHGPRLLRHVSLAVQRGETHGLVGESGAGKSMIGKAVAGLLPRGIDVAQGTIHFDGKDLLTLPRRTRRRVVGERIAIIPQDPLTALNPCRRIQGQMTDRLIHILGWPARKARQRASDLLEEVAIRDPDRVMRAYPHELSGGMRQRVLIAAAFVAEPALIIADEPTTALDVTVQRQVLRLIRDLQTRHDTALLFVTHDMGVVAKLCSSLTVIYGGHVVDQGDAAHVFGPEAHPYARALIAATPRYDRPDESLLPVPPQVIADLERDLARDIS